METHDMRSEQRVTRGMAYDDPVVTAPEKYQPDERPCFELYRCNPTVDATKRAFRCALCLPVRPL